MTPPLVSVITTSFNKGAYVLDALESVRRQDFTDWEHWVLENSTDGTTRELIRPYLDDPRIIYVELNPTAEERVRGYVTAIFLNRYMPRVNGKYILFLADDDVLDPDCLGKCARFLEEDPQRKVCWFSMRVENGPPPGLKDPGPDTGGIPALWPAGLRTALPMVDCRIDGGQVMHAKDCLDALTQPYYPEDSVNHVARHCDGLYLTKLAANFTFWNLPEYLMTHRATPLSIFDGKR